MLDYVERTTWGLQGETPQTGLLCLVIQREQHGVYREKRHRQVFSAWLYRENNMVVYREKHHRQSLLCLVIQREQHGVCLQGETPQTESSLLGYIEWQVSLSIVKHVNTVR